VAHDQRAGDDDARIVSHLDQEKVRAAALTRGQVPAFRLSDRCRVSVPERLANRRSAATDDAAESGRTIGRFQDDGSASAVDREQSGQVGCLRQKGEWRSRTLITSCARR